MNIIYKHKRIFRDIKNLKHVLGWTTKHCWIREAYQISGAMCCTYSSTAWCTWLTNTGWLVLRNQTCKRKSLKQTTLS